MMEQDFWAPLGASLIAAGVTALGIFTIRRFETWGRHYSIYFVSFAAGVLISVSFLHILPTAFSMSNAAPAWLLGGFVVLHVINRFIDALVCERDPDARFVIGLVPMIGIGLHSLIDGMIHAITFSVSTLTGVLAAVGMVLHEFPEGIITYLLLLRGGFSTQRALLLALAAASLSTPVGTLLAFPVVNGLSRPLLGALLALSAGALIYVGATHLLPQAEREPRRYSLLAMAAGVIVAVIIVATKEAASRASYQIRPQ